MRRALCSPPRESASWHPDPACRGRPYRTLPGTARQRRSRRAWESRSRSGRATRAAAADARSMACRISSGSATPEAGSQPEESKADTRVAAKASPARLVSAGGRARGKAGTWILPGSPEGNVKRAQAPAGPSVTTRIETFQAVFLAVVERLPLLAVAAEEIDRAGESGDRDSPDRACFASPGRRAGSERPGPRGPGPPADWAARPPRGGRRARRARGRSASIRQGRVTAAKADRQLVAVGAAGHEQRPVRRTGPRPGSARDDRLPARAAPRPLG